MRNDTVAAEKMMVNSQIYVARQTDRIVYVEY